MGLQVTLLCALNALYLLSTSEEAPPPPAPPRSHGDNGSSNLCLSDACLDNRAALLARASPVKPLSTWCNRNTARVGEEWQSLIFVKVPKAASSTTAGVALRIRNKTQCMTQYHHKEGVHYANVSRDQSFLVAPLREPSARAVSHAFFFWLHPLNFSVTDKNLIRSFYTQRGGMPPTGQGGYQFRYASPVAVPKHLVWRRQEPTHVVQPFRVMQWVKRIMDHYDFFIVTERLDESLTCLALLWQVPLHYVLVAAPAKQAGSYVLKRNKGPLYCEPYRKEVLSSGVRAYLRSDEWRAVNFADELLYRAAQISLNRTIASLGETFAPALQEFRRLQRQVVDACGPRLGSGCTAEGDVRRPVEACYERDFGCGYQCIDSVLGA